MRTISQYCQGGLPQAHLRDQILGPGPGSLQVFQWQLPDLSAGPRQDAADRWLRSHLSDCKRGNGGRKTLRHCGRLREWQK